MTMPITDALLHVLKSNPKVNVVKIEEKYDKISLEYPEYNPAHRFGISVAPSIGNENYDKPGLYTAKELNDFSLGLIPVVKGRQWHKAELRGDYFNGCLYLPNIHFFEIIGNKETRKTVTTTITDNSALESDVVQKFLDKNSKVEEENIQDIVEKHLVKSGLYEVAKAYILYRAERTKARELVKKENIKTL